MKVFPDLCIYISYCCKSKGFHNNIIKDFHNSTDKKHVLLLSVKNEFIYVYLKLKSRVRLKVVRLTRCVDEKQFFELLDDLKKERNGEIFSLLEKLYMDELFKNRRLIFKLFDTSCKVLHQNFSNTTNDCEIYDNEENIVKDEIDWILSEFDEFKNPVHSNDTHHLAGAIHYKNDNKVFVSADGIFRLFEINSDYKNLINSKCLDVLSPLKYVESYLFKAC